MREKALAQAGGKGLGYKLTKVVDDPDEYLARLIVGEFEVPTFLTKDSAIVYDEDHHPVQQEAQWFPFAMLIPKKAKLGAALPLAVFGHGIFGSGIKYLDGGWEATITHPMAEAGGAILIATNWIGLSEGDKDLIIAKIVPDLNGLSVVTDRLQQSLINNLTLTELAIGTLSKDPAVKVGQNDLIDPTKVYYHGVSLGGSTTRVGLSVAVVVQAVADLGGAGVDVRRLVVAVARQDRGVGRERVAEAFG
jgi:hypothetical protein